MTRSDKWKERPIVMRYRAFADELRLLWGVSNVPDRISLTFFIPMPYSWSAKKKEEMRLMPHHQKPDIDNLVKAVLDAMCEDDSYIYAIRAEKYWDDTGSIEVEDY